MAFFPAVETGISRRKAQQPDIYPNLLMTTLAPNSNFSKLSVEWPNPQRRKVAPQINEPPNLLLTLIPPWQIRPPIDGQRPLVRRPGAQIVEQPNLLLTTLFPKALPRIPYDWPNPTRRRENDANSLVTISFFPVMIGVGAVTEGPDTCVGVGTQAGASFVGSGAVTEQPDISVGVGVQAAPGTGAITEGPDTSVGVGITFDGIGTGSVLEGPDISNGVGRGGFAVITTCGQLDAYDNLNGSIILAWGPFSMSPDSFNIYVNGVLYASVPNIDDLDLMSGSPLQLLDGGVLQLLISTGDFDTFTVSGLQQTTYSSSAVAAPTGNSLRPQNMPPNGLVIPSGTYLFNVVAVIRGIEVSTSSTATVTVNPTSIMLTTPMKRLWPFGESGY
jgi:hypothetical protein